MRSVFGGFGLAKVNVWSEMAQIQLFLYLQLLDALTTLIGLRMGLSELSPAVRWMLSFGPAAGMAMCKGTALVLLGLCYWFNRRRVIRWVNYGFALLVVWNMGNILIALRAF